METVDDKLEIKGASKALHDEIVKKVRFWGYKLAYGKTWNDKGQEAIMITPQFASPLRHFYMFGPKLFQNQVSKVVPSEYTYKGQTFPVVMQYASIGKFL